MKIYTEGDKGRALCSHCKGLVSTTFVRRDVPFSDAQGLAKAILVGVCDQCGQVVSVPAQSTPAIRQARAVATHAIEAVLPPVYLDVLDLAAYSIEPAATPEHRRLLLTYFVHRDAEDPGAAQRLRVYHAQAVQHWEHIPVKNKRRLSLKVAHRAEMSMAQLMVATSLNKTQVIKSLVAQIQYELLEAPQPAVVRELKRLAEVW